MASSHKEALHSLWTVTTLWLSFTLFRITFWYGYTTLLHEQDMRTDLSLNKICIQIRSLTICIVIFYLKAMHSSSNRDSASKGTGPMERRSNAIDYFMCSSHLVHAHNDAVVFKQYEGLCFSSSHIISSHVFVGMDTFMAALKETGWTSMFDPSRE